MRSLTCHLIAALLGVLVLRAQDDGAIPRPLRDETFDALMANSPFTRSLGIYDSLILTGVARFDQGHTFLEPISIGIGRSPETPLL